MRAYSQYFRDAFAFKESFSNNTASATAEHIAASADEASKARQGMIKVRILDGIVKNRYANDTANSQRGFQQATSKKHFAMSFAGVYPHSGRIVLHRVAMRRI